MIGTLASEEIVDGGGTDNLFGRGGRDVFVLVADGQPDSIKDFQIGQDQIDLTDWQTSFDDLSITRHSSGKVIIRAVDEVLSVNDGAWTLDPSDLVENVFLF